MWGQDKYFYMVEKEKGMWPLAYNKRKGWK